jgi:hypothetical protein
MFMGNEKCKSNGFTRRDISGGARFCPSLLLGLRYAPVLYCSKYDAGRLLCRGYSVNDEIGGSIGSTLGQLAFSLLADEKFSITRAEKSLATPNRIIVHDWKEL